MSEFLDGLIRVATLLGALVAALVASRGAWLTRVGNEKISQLTREGNKNLELLKTNLKVVEGWNALLIKNEFEMYQEIWASLPDIQTTINVGFSLAELMRPAHPEGTEVSPDPSQAEGIDLADLPTDIPGYVPKYSARVRRRTKEAARKEFSQSVRNFTRTIRRNEPFIQPHIWKDLDAHQADCNDIDRTDRMLSAAKMIEFNARRDRILGHIRARLNPAMDAAYASATGRGPGAV